MERIKIINEGLKRRFGGDDPYQIITRLAEECGELASQVNQFENSGIKQEKNGAPDRTKLAKEVQDVIRCALQIAAHYDIEFELENSINESLRRLQSEGLIDP